MEPKLVCRDSSCIATLQNLKDWFSLLSEQGPEFGYFPQPSKTVLVVDASYEAEALSILGIRVVSGQRFLGSLVGDQQSTEAFINQKV